MTTESTNRITTPEAMEIDMDKMKKCVQVAKSQADHATTAIAINETPSPEIKKSRNDETPMPHAQVKALFLNQKEHIKQGTMTGTDETQAKKATLKAGEKPPEVSSIQENQAKTNEQHVTAEVTMDNDKPTEESKKHQTPDQKAGPKEDQSNTDGSDKPAQETEENNGTDEDTNDNRGKGDDGSSSRGQTTPTSTTKDSGARERY